MENKRTSIWTVIFWIVTVLCVLQYLLLGLPKLSQNPNATGAYYLGGMLPNTFIILIFWFIKRAFTKK